MNTEPNRIHVEVRAHYAAAAKVAESGRAACCGPDNTAWGAAHYDDLGDLPGAAALASLGCGNPTAVADLHPGETVLDLGSGGGIDVLLSARRVGPTGFAYGLDMTPEMLALARRNAAEAGATNVEFLEGEIEHIPLPDGSVDVIVSNCVINLSPDKPAVFAEMRRVLRPGGRIGVSDVVTDDELSEAERLERGTYVGCIAGALPISAYGRGLRAAGFVDVSITCTHTVGEGIHSAIITARAPAEDPAAGVPAPRARPGASAGRYGHRVDPDQLGESGEVTVGAHDGQAVLDAQRGERGVGDEPGA
jgi:SAM-dependent methyltransferase